MSIHCWSRIARRRRGVHPARRAGAGRRNRRPSSARPGHGLTGRFVRQRTRIEEAINSEARVYAALHGADVETAMRGSAAPLVLADRDKNGQAAGRVVAARAGAGRVVTAGPQLLLPAQSSSK
jgi:hypothetical protein